MDTRLAKHAPPLPFQLPDGTLVHLRPLPRAQLARLWLDAELHLKAIGAPAFMLLDLVHRRTLEAAAGRDLAPELHAEELEALWEVWSWWQRQCCPSDERLNGWLRRRVNDDNATQYDGWQAHNAGSARVYYGCDEVDLTEGQVAYWHLLAAAYREWHVPDKHGRRKVPTKQWLTSSDE